MMNMNVFFFYTHLVVALKWPLTILIIFFFLINPLKSILSIIPNLLNKAENIEIPNFLKMNMPLGQKESLSLEDKGLQYLQAFESPLIISEQNEIHKDIIDNKLSNKQAIITLIYQLAHQNVNVYLLYTDRYMMQHQIHLLEKINTSSNPLTDDNLRDLCILKESHDHALCLKYLLDRNLIQKTSDGYITTLHGKEYLSFRAKIPPFYGR